ncbi:hypothetical protein R6Q59_004805 [Mikania micrantha]
MLVVTLVLEIYNANIPEKCSGAIPWFVDGCMLTVMWKLVEKLMMPKKAKAPAKIQLAEGVKKSFAARDKLVT